MPPRALRRSLLPLLQAGLVNPVTMVPLYRTNIELIDYRWEWPLALFERLRVLCKEQRPRVSPQQGTFAGPHNEATIYTQIVYTRIKMRVPGDCYV